MYTAQLQKGGINVEQLTKDQIKVIFILRLPFRLRVGKLHRFKCNLERSFEVCFRNTLEIPEGTEIKDVLQHLKGNYENLWTDAMIIVEQPIIEESDLKVLRQSNELTESSTTNLTKNAFEAIKVLNQVIIAYSTTTKKLWGGKRLQMLSDLEFFESLLWEIVVLCPENQFFDDTDILEMFNLKPSRKINEVMSLVGEIDDLNEEKLLGIEETLVRQQEYIFYEYAFQAKTLMAARDFVGALLMAVVAFEGAHAAFVRYELSKRLKTQDKGKVSSLITNFLREQGLHTLIHLTPLLLMDEKERPSSDMLDKCAKGIEMRNAIMHALSNKNGKYKVRQKKPVDFSEVFTAVLNVYDCYVNALQQRLS